MKPTLKLLLLASVATFVFACCSQSRKERNQNQATPGHAGEMQHALPATSTAAIENKKDTAHKFIRTADIKFKVKDVVKASYAIEDIVASHGGFVAYTNLTSTINSTSTVAVSADSSLETTRYSVINDIKLRIPNTALDTTLKSIARLVDYIDYRQIRADDVALQMLSNKLKQQRMSKSEKRLAAAIDSHGKKLEETATAEEALLNKAEQADDAMLSNLSTQDHINYSTVTLEVYQPQAAMHTMISSNKPILAYTPPFATRLTASLKSGWLVVEGILLFFAEIWWLLVVILLGLTIYRRIGKVVAFK
ncbi:MAG TPA: DUF4349 domain-containing protein [Chitinophagales bacterium]|nr:DUF4349 domain-containing protein [Chitinophagales bacterium]